MSLNQKKGEKPMKTYTQEIQKPYYMIEIEYDDYGMVDEEIKCLLDGCSSISYHRNYCFPTDDNDFSIFKRDEDLDEVLSYLKENNYAFVYLYAYVHGDIHLSMSKNRVNPYSCQWDSGFFGVVYSDKQSQEELEASVDASLEYYNKGVLRVALYIKGEYAVSYTPLNTTKDIDEEIEYLCEEYDINLSDIFIEDNTHSMKYSKLKLSDNQIKHRSQFM